MVIAVLVPAVPAAGQHAGDEPPLREQLQALGKQFVPKKRPSTAVRQGTAAPRGANPWLSLLSPQQADKVDMGYWRQVAEARGERRADQRVRALDVGDDEFLVDERERDNVRGRNDTQATAQFIRRLGTGGNDRSQAKILGTLASWPAATPVGPFAEDDGAIPLASPIAIDEVQTVVVEGEIGDGPHGSAGSGNGDFDYFELSDLSAGDEIAVDVDTPEPFAGLDPVVVVYNSAGEAVAFNDDDGESYDSRLLFTVLEDGDYFVAIEGCCTFQVDPFDSGSGLGADTEGVYTVRMGRNVSEVDFYSFDLEAGDVVSAKVSGGAANIRLLAPDGTEVMGSSQDASFLYPMDTQLTGGGNAVLDHVAAADGRFALRVAAGEGDYESTVRVVRPGFEQRANAVQTLFLDFDGEEVNTGVFGGAGVRQLSPLSAFLSRWGLSAADEDAVIAKTVATVRENVRRDLVRRGASPDFDVRIRHSRNHDDRFGRNNVSRVIVGGTIAESGVGTIGIAQSIDPGNFEGSETALVLLDILSEPAGSEIAGDATLNHYITPESDVVEFVGQALGNVIAHEIGHYIGNWHVDTLNDTVNLMDEGGGDFGMMFGVGPDRVGGTEDDTDVDFGVDTFSLFEGFTGLEDTLNRSAFGLTGDVAP
jgi:hypothetical protein